MEKLYIRLKKWSQESLNKAIEEAEKKGYKQREFRNSITQWKEILILNDDWDYFTSQTSAEDLNKEWYKEHIIGEEIEYKPHISEIKYRDNIFTFIFDKDFLLATIFLNWETIANDFLPNIDNLWLLTNNSEANEVFETDYNVDILNRWMDYVLDYKSKNNGME